jgi:hypothetical protein
MKGLVPFALTLTLIFSVYPAAASASRCTSEQREKMARGGLSSKEIAQLCDGASPLSLEEASQLLTAYAKKHRNQGEWDQVELPTPGNILIHDLNRYYPLLRKEGYITRWEVDPSDRNDIKLELTEKGKQFIQAAKYFNQVFGCLL